MTLLQYLQGISHTTQLSETDKIEITGITSDSRQIKKDCIFVCIKGEKFDGHTAAQQAVDEGAAAVVVQRDMGIGCQVVVENTRAAYAVLCANHFDNPSRKLKLIGVTGTNGKTTITSLVKSILNSAGKKTGLIGTIRNEIMELALPAKYTTPDPYQLHALLARMVEAGCEYVAMEVSSHALDQHRLEGCAFEVGVFTNLTQDHLDYHGTMENYFQAKRKLFGYCRSAVVNIDDDYGVKLAQELGKAAITCSLKSDLATYTAKNIEYSAAGSRFLLVAEGAIQRVQVPMPGSFSVMNAMQAAVAARCVGVSLQEVAEGLNHCYGVTGRAEVIPTPGRGYTIIRDYAHSPDGIEKTLAALREFHKGRIVTLFGCAGKRDRTKRPIMAGCAAAGSDFVILTSDNPRDEDPLQIINDAKPGLDRYNVPYRIIPDRYTAILWAIDNLKDGDLLLLAGKGHEDYQVLHDETIYFDERVIVEGILAADNDLGLLKERQEEKTEKAT